MVRGAGLRTLRGKQGGKNKIRGIIAKIRLNEEPLDQNSISLNFFQIGAKNLFTVWKFFLASGGLTPHLMKID